MAGGSSWPWLQVDETTYLGREDYCRGSHAESDSGELGWQQELMLSAHQ